MIRINLYKLLIILGFFGWFCESIYSYIIYEQKYIQIEKDIIQTEKTIEKLKNIDIKKYDPIGMSAKSFDTNNPIMQFEKIIFIACRRETKDIKTFDTRIYRNITTDIDFICDFTEFIKLLNFLEEQNFLFKIHTITFKKIKNEQINCKIKFDTIVYFNVT